LTLDRTPMPDRRDDADHAKPFICETLTSKALYFSFSDTQSRMQLLQPDALDLEYTRTMMGFLLFEPRPARLAMIGLGGGSLAKFCFRQLPAATIDVVEINPHVIALRDEFQVPPDGPRFQVIEGDGAHFVRYSPKRFEVLLVDGFDIHGQPAALGSQHFYDDCLDVLQPGGILVVNLHSGHLQCASQMERIRRSFGGSMLVVDDGEHSNSVVFACKGDTLERRAARASRPPRGMEKRAWTELMPALSRVAAALRELGGAERERGRESGI